MMSQTTAHNIIESPLRASILVGARDVGDAISGILEANVLYRKTEISFKCLDAYLEEAISTFEPSSGGGAPFNQVATKKEDAKPIRDKLKPHFKGETFSKHLWFPVADPAKLKDFLSNIAPALSPGLQLPILLPPRLELFCENCESKRPFSPRSEPITNIVNVDQPPIQQTICCTYGCLGCQQKQLTFMLARAGKNIALTGRSDFPDLDFLIRKALNKTENQLLRSATISQAAGFDLAAVAYMRSLLECYIRRVLGDNVTRDWPDLHDKYKLTLSAHFKINQPSLDRLYGLLSAALHTTEIPVNLVDDAIKAFDLHLSAKELDKKHPLSDSH